jgi:3-oxocholest-4-en-26-oate---CoA ligase
MLHFAELFEAIAELQPDAAAVLHDQRSVTWREFDAQAGAFAGFLEVNSISAGDSVALMMLNCPEYLIAQYGVFKHSCTPVNINYRYLADEIAHILNDSGARVVVFHSSLAERIVGLSTRCPTVTAWVEVDDRVGRHAHGEPGIAAMRWSDVITAFGSAPYVPLVPRSEEEVYLLYTGGTTGLPKGVMFQMSEFVRRMFTGYLYRGWTVPTTKTEMLQEIRAHISAGDRRVSLVGCPLMHGTGMWLGTFYSHLMGGAVATLPGRSFDAAELWSTAARIGADAITIVGDAFARPMQAELDRAASAGSPYDLSELRIIQSSGVMFSAEVQQGLFEHLDIRIVDSMGSTEGAMARRISTRETVIDTARFTPLPGTIVVDDDLRPIPAGSGIVGRVAASASVPIGYRNDPVKSAATFVQIEGRRSVMAGDWATIEADGSIVLLGRGSGCINTGGEKVFPEEVEEALKRHDEVIDALVVAVPDERLGSLVGAVVSLRGGALVHRDDLIAFVRTQLAGYKAPRVMSIVSTVQRSPSGKADYDWARTALAADHS